MYCMAYLSLNEQTLINIDLLPDLRYMILEATNVNRVVSCGCVLIRNVFSFFLIRVEFVLFVDVYMTILPLFYAPKIGHYKYQIVAALLKTCICNMYCV